MAAVETLDADHWTGTPATSEAEATGPSKGLDGEATEAEIAAAITRAHAAMDERADDDSFEASAADDAGSSGMADDWADATTSHLESGLDAEAADRGDDERWVIATESGWVADDPIEAADESSR